MNKSSYVSIERGVCVVCGQRFNGGTLIIERHPPVDSCLVGWELCRTDAQMHRLGFVALVECDLDVSDAKSGERIAPDEAHRTGGVLHLTQDNFMRFFKREVPSSIPCVYVPEGTLQQLHQIMRRQFNLS